jgi:hypothetical protein
VLTGTQGHAAPRPPSPQLTELQRAYRTLQVAEGAPLAVANAAYKAMMLTARAHPDVGGSTARSYPIVG